MLSNGVSSIGDGFAAKQSSAPSPAPSVSAAAAAPSPSPAPASSFSAPLPAARELQPNTAKIPMDDHEFSDFLGSLSRGLMKDADQIRKIKAAASAHHFTCKQAIAMSDVVKGHPGEAIITLFPALVDVDKQFESVLLNLKWAEERQEVITALKLDASKFPNAFKKK
jgi:hypothetical protein